MQRLNMSVSEIYPTPHGVVTLSGYGIVVRVDRGHLLLQDGIASERRQGRLPRVGHGLKRPNLRRSRTTPGAAGPWTRRAGSGHGHGCEHVLPVGLDGAQPLAAQARLPEQPSQARERMLDDAPARALEEIGRAHV